MELNIPYFISCVAMAWLCGIMFVQPSWQRFLICLVFCADCIGHAALDSRLSDVNYYVSGIALTVVVLGLIAMFARQNKFTDLMMGACLFSIILNVAGFISYKYQLGFGGAYEILFAMFYISMIGIFLSDERGDSENNGRSWYHLPYRKRNIVFNPLREKA
jgi:hypothetical protein